MQRSADMVAPTPPPPVELRTLRGSSTPPILSQPQAVIGVETLSGKTQPGPKPKTNIKTKLKTAIKKALAKVKTTVERVVDKVVAFICMGVLGGFLLVISCGSCCLNSCCCCTKGRAHCVWPFCSIGWLSCSYRVMLGVGLVIGKRVPNVYILYIHEYYCL